MRRLPIHLPRRKLSLVQNWHLCLPMKVHQSPHLVLTLKIGGPSFPPSLPPSPWETLSSPWFLSLLQPGDWVCFPSPLDFWGLWAQHCSKVTAFPAHLMSVSLPGPEREILTSLPCSYHPKGHPGSKKRSLVHPTGRKETQTRITSVGNRILEQTPGDGERRRFPKLPDCCQHMDVSEIEVPHLPGRPEMPTLLSGVMGLPW